MTNEWEYGTCKVIGGISKKENHIFTRRHKINKNVQVSHYTNDKGEEYWINISEEWWENFIPNDKF